MDVDTFFLAGGGGYIFNMPELVKKSPALLSHK